MLKKIEQRTEDFLEAIAYLKSKGMEPTTEILLGLPKIKSSSTISEIKGKRQNIQPETWEAFKEKYKAELSVLNTEKSEIPKEDKTETKKDTSDINAKYIALLEKSLQEKEKENQELKDTLNNVQASLDVILRNQSTMDATFQASIEEMAKHVAKDEAGTLLQSIYTAAAVIELDNRKMDNRLQIGNVRNL